MRRVFFSGLLYIMVANTTNDAPITNEKVAWKSKNRAEMMQDTTMLKEVANTFITREEEGNKGIVTPGQSRCSSRPNKESSLYQEEKLLENVPFATLSR